MSRLRTPIIKPRTQGGTFYTFGSALEDVGLNINELKNKVALSHYVLLNIPAFEATDSFDGSCNKGDYTFAQKFQNYALNMETVLRNQDTYNFAESLTVSERVFWKWLQKEGWISFVKDDKNENYYVDSSTFGNDSVIKAFGLISAGAQRTDAYGIYNETFVQIPSSYGQMKVLLKPVSDKNYYITRNNEIFDTSCNLIENVDESECDENHKLHTGISAEAEFDSQSPNGYTVEDETKELCVEFSLSELRKYYDDDTLDYDSIGIGANENIRSADVNGNFTFNSVLVYYSIYDSTGKNILATNAYGLLLLDSAQPESDTNYVYPSFTKKQSGVNDAGNSYSFRINAKTSSVYNGDIKVTDNTTPAYAMSTDFNDTIRNLAVAVETLRSNANLVSVLCDQNAAIKELTIKSLDKIDDIEKDIMSLKTGKVKELKTSMLITDALSANTLDSSLEIGDYGSFDGSIFSYNTIKANKVLAKDSSIKNLIVTKITGEDEEILLGDYGKISSNGLFTSTVFFNSETSETEDMNVADALNIIDSLSPKKDGNFIINTNVSSLMVSSNNIGEADSVSEVSGNDKLNVKTLLASLVKLMQTMELFDISGDDSSSGVAAILDKLDSFTDDTNELRQSIEDLTADLSDIAEQVDSFTTSIEILDSSVADIYSKLGETDTAIENNASQIADVSTNQSLLADKVNELETSVQNIDSSINEMYSILSDYNTLFDNIGNDIDVITEDVSTLKDDSSTLKSKVSNLETSVTNIDSSLQKIVDLDASIQALDTSVRAHDASIQDLYTKVNAIMTFLNGDDNAMSNFNNLYDYIANIIS